MPLDVEFKTSGATRREVIQVNEREQTFDFKLDAKPQSVALDPDEWVLKVLTINEGDEAKMAKIFALSYGFLCLAAYAGDNWPQFRGPEETGHSDARGLPLNWSETNNVVWKTPIHDRGWSSPVIYGDQIWLTTAAQDGRKLYGLRRPRDGPSWQDMKLFDGAAYAHPFNTYASPTPVIGRWARLRHVRIAGHGLHRYEELQGSLGAPRHRVQPFSRAGSSPIIFRNLLIMHFDGSDHQFVVALDKQTGKTVWMTKRR